MKAKVGHKVKPMGCSIGYWNMATLRVAPIRLVQMATKYPIMLAALLEERNTCRKVDRPICARIHPRKTIPRTIGDVLRKKAMSRKM